MECGERWTRKDDGGLAWSGVCILKKPLAKSKKAGPMAVVFAALHLLSGAHFPYLARGRYMIMVCGRSVSL